MRSLFMSAGATVLMTSLAFAQRDEVACDREARSSNSITLETPLGEGRGRVCLDDGDSFSIGPTWLRIRGIDAPEIGRNCVGKFDNRQCARFAKGNEALVELSRLLEAGAKCSAKKRDQYNRWVADCALPDNRNLAREMVAGGYACTTQEGPELRSTDIEARKQGVGLWKQDVGGINSKHCIVTNRTFKRHLQYQQFKNRRERAAGQN